VCGHACVCVCVEKTTCVCGNACCVEVNVYINKDRYVEGRVCVCVCCVCVGREVCGGRFVRSYQRVR